MSTDPTRKSSAWADLGVTSNPALRRLFGFKVLAVLAYGGSLWLPWLRQRGFMSSETELHDGWGATAGLSLAFFAATLLLSAFRASSVPRRGHGRLVATLGLLASLAAFLITLTGADLLVSRSDHRPGFILALLLAAAIVWLSFVEIRRPAFVEKDAGEPQPAWSRIADESAVREVVLVVHGTGSAEPSAVGETWWQVGGSFWEWLSERVPGPMRCQYPSEVFRWSGANSERHRRRAGKAFLEHLRGLRKTGLRYHVVAHSHGGSVVWNALERAGGREPLDHLGRIVILGTPFLHFRVAGSWPSIAAGLALSSAALAICQRPLLEWWAVRGDVTGSVDSVLLSFCTGLLCTLFAVHLYRAALLVLSWIRLTGVRRRRRHAFDLFAPRLRCLWADDDEALNGLATSTTLRGGVLSGGAAAAESLQGSLLAAPLRVVYHELVAPVLDQLMWRRLLNMAQGSDLAGLELHAVTPGPLPDLAQPSLKPEVGDRLSRWADENASRVIGKLRRTLGLPLTQGVSVADLGQALGSQLAGDELVHWGLYQQRDVRDEILQALTCEEPPADWQPYAWVEGAAAEVESPIHARTRWASLILQAVMFLILGWTVFDAHWDSVYPLTGRFQVASVLARAPVEEAIRARQLAAVKAWTYEVLRTGVETEFFLPAVMTSDRNWSPQLMAIQALTEQGAAEAAKSAAMRIEAPLEWACAQIYLLAMGEKFDVAATPPGEGWDVAKIGESNRRLAQRLGRELAPELLRSCVYQRSRRLFYSEPDWMAEASSLAEAWTGEERVRQQLLELWRHSNGKQELSWLNLSKAEFERRSQADRALKRRRSLDQVELVHILLVWAKREALDEWGDHKSMDQTAALAEELLRRGDWRVAAGLADAFCAEGTTPPRLQPALEDNDQIAWRLRRCGLLEGRDPERARDVWSDLMVGRDPRQSPSAEELDQVLDLVAADAARFAKPIRALLERDVAGDSLHRSVVWSQLGILLARAGKLHQAVDAAGRCESAGDRLAVYAEVLRHYSDSTGKTAEALRSHYEEIRREADWAQTPP